MILPYNKSQKEIIDLKFHTYIYSVFKKLGLDINLIGTKYFYEMVIIAGSLNTGIIKKNSLLYKYISLKNLEETLAEELNITSKEIKNNVDYAFNNIDLKTARKDFNSIFKIEDEEYFNPKLIQAKELLIFLVEEIEFKYRIQTSNYGPHSEDWVSDSVELNNADYLEELRKTLDNQQKNNKND